jgi:DNA-binding response OmpR family regulator
MTDLERENELLRDRVAQLEDAMGLGFMPPPEWGLTRSERLLLGVLMAREIATKNAVMAGLYGMDVRDPPFEKIVDVLISKLRKKLVPHGITIETRWGEGHFLSPAMKSRVRAAVGRKAAA